MIKGIPSSGSSYLPAIIEGAARAGRSIAGYVNPRIVNAVAAVAAPLFKAILNIGSSSEIRPL